MHFHQIFIFLTYIYYDSDSLELFCVSDGYGARVLNTLRWLTNKNEFPLVLGREFCGVVKQKGSAVRADIQVGDKVWGVISPHQDGSIAEYVVINEIFVSFINDISKSLSNI